MAMSERRGWRNESPRVRLSGVSVDLALEPRLAGLVLGVQAAVGALFGLLVSFFAWSGVVALPGGSHQATWVTLGIYGLVGGLLSAALAPPAEISVSH
jgi:VIT1/CCC1 family predicted Fe2+/Mn2+ transporter